MIIEETHGGCEIKIVADVSLDLRQGTDWIQIDEIQARQLIEVLQKWLNGEVLE